MKKTIITWALSLALSQSGVNAGEISSSPRTASEKNKARVAEICKDPSVRAQMARPDDICEVSKDGGIMWEAIGAAALAALAISGSTYMIRRRKQEKPVEADMLMPASLEKDAVEIGSDPSDWETVPGDIAWLGIESASEDESPSEPWESAEYTNHVGIDSHILRMLWISESAHEYADHQLSALIDKIHNRIEECKARFCAILKTLVEKDGVIEINISPKEFEKIEILMLRIGEINIPPSMAIDYVEIRDAEVLLKECIKEKKKQINLLLEGTRNNRLSQELYENIESLNQSLLKLQEATEDNEKNGAFSSKYGIMLSGSTSMPLDFDVGEINAPDLDAEL